MKVVHISTSDADGAGMCAYRIHKSLLTEGIDSQMVVMRKTSNDRNVHVVRSLMNDVIMFYERVCSRFSFMRIIETNYHKIQKFCNENESTYSSPHSLFRLDRNKYIKEADIIHIHWISGFIDYPSFFKNIDKPIIWTLHDENFLWGTAHYSKSLLKENATEKEYYNVKKDAYSYVKRLGIVMLSKTFYEPLKSHEFLKNRTIRFIPNSVDINVFKIYDKHTSRDELSLPAGCILLSFIACDILDPRKGLNLLIEVVESLENPNIKILAIGNDYGRFQGHQSVIHVGAVYDEVKLAKYISSSDIFILSSSEESFSQTAIEAIACGVPGVMFPVGIAPELITKENGILCSDFSKETLLSGIKESLINMYSRNIVRQTVVERFSPQTIANKYIDFYKEICSQKLL